MPTKNCRFFGQPALSERCQDYESPWVVVSNWVQKATIRRTQQTSLRAEYDASPPSSQSTASRMKSPFCCALISILAFCWPSFTQGQNGTCSLINVRAYDDYNINGSLQTGEPGLPNMGVNVSAGTQHQQGITDVNGIATWAFGIPSGIVYSITIPPYTLSENWISVFPTFWLHSFCYTYSW